MELRTLGEEVETDRIRKILVVATEVVGIEEGDKIIAMTMTVVVAMVTETTTVEGVVLTTMIVVDHRNVVTMV